MWALLTGLPKEKIGLAVTLSLTERRREVAIELCLRAGRRSENVSKSPIRIKENWLYCIQIRSKGFLHENQ